ncbi:hypothetical protein NAEX_09339 [Nannocystis exedens]|nr:hypothetical protein NAEX_09339 [Nannocystis exedens]
MAWAGIPRKSDELLTGFQRFRNDERVDREVVPFFQNPKNCSPTAVIVGLRRDTGLAKCLLDKNVIEAGCPVQATLTIEIDDKALSSNQIFESALSFVRRRLQVSSGNALLEVEDTPSENEGNEEDEGEDSEDEDGISEEIHLGSSTLLQMKEKLEDRSNWENGAFRKAIEDYVKPAFLIDGQHRVSAAAKIGMKGLPFIVCGLYDADWEEQVFQFTVVNLKPKPIPPSLITSIAALSLTKQEQKEIEGRLTQAGVRMREVSMMSLVGYDPESPFADLIDMAVGDPRNKSQKLGYGALKRIASEWQRGTRESMTLIAKSLADTTSERVARAVWRDTSNAPPWFQFFCVFWKAIRDSYPAELWSKGKSRLFIGAHLWALQEVILLQADAQVASTWNVRVEPGTDEEEARQIRFAALAGKLQEVVAHFVQYFPVEMWKMEWARESMDTNAGRKELVDLFNLFISEGKKAGGVWKRWRSDEWFKVKKK